MIVKTTVDLRLKVHCNSSWSNDTKISQVKKQSLEDAMNIINKALEHSTHNIEIMSDHKCIGIVITDE